LGSLLQLHELLVVSFAQAVLIRLYLTKSDAIKNTANEIEDNLQALLQHQA